MTLTRVIDEVFNLNSKRLKLFNKKQIKKSVSSIIKNN